MNTDYGYRRDGVRTRGHSREDADAEAGSERWLISYADLITTLMVFFLALYVLQLAKTREAEIKSFETHVIQDRAAAAKDGIADAVANARELARKSLLSQLEMMRDSKQITVKEGVQGVEIGIDARILFNSGDARLLPQSFDVLDEIATALRKQTESNLLVEGHTDSVPISNARYASNWELSSAREGAVVRFLVDRGVGPRRLAGLGRPARPLLRADGESGSLPTLSGSRGTGSDAGAGYGDCELRCIFRPAVWRAKSQRSDLMSSVWYGFETGCTALLAVRWDSNWSAACLLFPVSERRLLWAAVVSWLGMSASAAPTIFRW
jgi:chemotaxis protein MotB